MGIANDRSGAINTSPISNFGDTNLPPKGVSDFMEAFRNGFITTDDLVKRGLAAPAEFAAAGQNTQDQLQLRPLARQQQVGALSADIALQPKRASNAMAVEDLRTGQIGEASRALKTPDELRASDAERAKDAQFRNALASDQPSVRQAALAGASNNKIYDLWTAAHGQPPPDQIEIKNFDPTFQPKPIEDWIIDTYGQSALAQDAQAVINRPDIQKGYAEYANAAKNRPLTYFKGDPEYDAKLRKDLEAADLKVAIQGAEIKALPDVLAKKAEAPGKAAAQNQQAASALQKEYGTRQEIQDLRKVQAAYYKIQRVLDPNTPPSAQRDQAAIFSWMKILDPGSTVREGEYATAKNARGVPERITSLWNQALTGQILTPNQRTLFKEAVEPVFQGQVQAALPTIKQFLGQEAGLNADGAVVPPEDAALITGLTAPNSASAKSGVQPGDVVTLKDGRRIKVKAVTPNGIIPDTSFTQ
jgi:hypothetical protein